MSSTRQPLVSVLMTSYNREKYIADAIESVLASTLQDFELIICDDTSSDSTVDIAHSYAAKDSRIRVYVNEKNLGDYNNRNKTASYATGKYLKYLDSDDMIYPWGLAAMVGCMEKEPEAGFGLMSYNLAQRKPYPVLVRQAQAYKAFFFKSALVQMGPSGAIFRKDAFDACGGFSGKPYVGDSEMWLKMARRYPLVRMPLDLIWWREHEGQQFREGIKVNYYAVNQFKVYKEALLHPDCPLSPEERRMVLNNLQNARIRQVMLENLPKMRLKNISFLLKESDIGLFDLWKGMRRNKYGPVE